MIRKILIIGILMVKIIQPNTASASKMESKDFLWGAATSAHQIEGGDIDTNWLRFEKEGRNDNEDNTLKAVDGYNRAIDDIKLLKELNLNAYRFSIEWARVEPQKGQFDEKALEHYHNLIIELKKNNIEPIVTLHHFTDPGWVTDKGGWLNRETINDFKSYVEKTVNYMGDDVKYWITINEPSVFLSYSYLYGQFPPYRRNLYLYWKAFRNVLSAHGETYNIIHQRNKEAIVGFSYNFTNFAPKKDIWLDKKMVQFGNYLFSWYWIDMVKDKMDFIGLNQYKKYYLGFGSPFADQFYKSNNKTDFGWNIQPEALGDSAKEIYDRYKKPIMVTENGLPDAKDTKRADFIRDNVGSLMKAKNSGVPVIGYLYWSLMDNFEWFVGYDVKFGLYEVDMKTFERKMRPSALYYRDLIKEYQR